MHSSYSPLEPGVHGGTRLLAHLHPYCQVTARPLVIS
jgi:hypothetical protein